MVFVAVWLAPVEVEFVVLVVVVFLPGCVCVWLLVLLVAFAGVGDV